MRKKKEITKIRTTGIIQYAIDNEPGVIRYIVAVNLNGCTVKAQSIYYSSESKKLLNGTMVDVEYWESPNGINRMCEILDDNMLPCYKYSSDAGKVYLRYGLFFLAVIIICIIRKYV